jgi:hypothetical protein
LSSYLHLGNMFIFSLCIFNSTKYHCKCGYHKLNIKCSKILQLRNSLQQLHHAFCNVVTCILLQHNGFNFLYTSTEDMFLTRVTMFSIIAKYRSEKINLKFVATCSGLPYNYKAPHYQTSCYLLFLRLKYSSKNFVLRHSQSMFSSSFRMKGIINIK